MAIAAGLVFAPLGPRDEELSSWAMTADEAIRSLDRGDAREASGRFARAEEALGSVRKAQLSTTARMAIASFYLRYGIALESMGRREEAIREWERAVDSDPNDAWTLGRLSMAYERDGRTQDAARIRRRLESAPGGRGQLRLSEGWSAAGRGDLAEAEKKFEEAIDAAPDLAMAWEGLIRVRIQAGRYIEASRALDTALASGLDPVSGKIYESSLAIQRGDLRAARRALEQVPATARPRDAVLARFLDESRRAIEAQDPPR